MEFLWVDLTLTAIDFAADDDKIQFELRTGSAPSAIATINNGNVIANKILELQGAGTPLIEMPLRINLQDQNGFGQLVATDRINISATSVGMAAAVNFNWRIYYRYVTVGAEEYIGIVQSQTMG